MDLVSLGADVQCTGGGVFDCRNVALGHGVGDSHEALRVCWQEVAGAGPWTDGSHAHWTLQKVAVLCCDDDVTSAEQSSACDSAIKSKDRKSVV